MRRVTGDAALGLHGSVFENEWTGFIGMTTEANLVLRRVAYLVNRAKSIGPKEQALEQIVTRLSLDPGVTAVSWEVAAAVDAEDASITTSDQLVSAGPHPD